MAKKPGGCAIALIITAIILGTVGFWVYRVWYWNYTPAVFKALECGNFHKAEQIVDKMADVAEKRLNTNCTWDDYKTAYYQVLNTEIEYLLNDGSTLGVDRLVALLQGKKMGAVPVVGLTSDKNVIAANERYNVSVARHHSIMDNIIARAIATKNRYLATSIIQCYRPILVKNIVEVHLLKSDECEYSYSYEPQKQAESRVQEAIENGEL